MAMAYGWIDKELADYQKANRDQCPLKIFRLRFVYAGVATMNQDFSFRPAGDHDSDTQTQTVSTSTGSLGAPIMRVKPSIVYLLEEQIPRELGEFTKYIHNSQAVPALPSFAGRDYDVAVFLCFIQHIQYKKSKHLVFLSDFQGKSSC